MAHNIFKRTGRTLAVTAMIGLLGLTAACAGDPAGSGQAENGDVETRFSWWGNETRAKLTNDAIAAFEAENPGIKVKAEYSDLSGYFDKLATQVAANDAPDVITLGGAYPAEYANRGALLDLADVSDVLNLGGLDEGTVRNGQVKGAQYGVSTGANALAIVVNPAVFQAAGVDIPDDETWTWDDFAAVSAEVTAKSPKGTYGTATVLTHDSLDAFARQRGEALYTEDGKLNVGQDTVAEFLTYSLKLSDEGAAPSASEIVEKLNVSAEQTLMGTGQAAMMLNWSSSVTALGKATGADLELLKLPGEEPTPGIWLQSSQFYTISSRTKQADAAAKLVNFLVSNEKAAKSIQNDRGVPSNSDMRAAIAEELTPQGKVESAYIDEIGKVEFAPTFIGPTGSTAVAEITARISTEVLFKRLTPEAGAAQWIQESKAAIGQ